MQDGTMECSPQTADAPGTQSRIDYHHLADFLPLARRPRACFGVSQEPENSTAQSARWSCPPSPTQTCSPSSSASVPTPSARSRRSTGEIRPKGGKHGQEWSKSLLGHGCNAPSPYNRLGKLLVFIAAGTENKVKGTELPQRYEKK